MKELIKEHFGNLSEDIIDVLSEHGKVIEIEKGQEILRQGQYVKVIPLVIKGVLSVVSRYEDRELLLYYITAGQSCIMSFTSGLKRMPSRVVAVAEQDTTALLVPVEPLHIWLRRYPELNSLFFHEFDTRYLDLLNTIHQVLFLKLDQRLIHHLIQKSTISNKKRVKITHKQLALELGTSREVVSRVIGVLEKEGRLKQFEDGIEAL